MKRKKRIIVVPYGLPLSGKTTFLKAMRKKYPYLFSFGTGDYFRSLKKKTAEELTELDKEILSTKPGCLVKDSLVTQIVKQELKKLQAEIDAAGLDIELVIMDGYPRTVAQLEDVENDKIFGDDIVIYVIIDVSEEIVRERAAKRRVCKLCNDVVEITTEDIGREDLVCEKCGGLLVSRDDDADLEIRIEEYNLKTKPMLPKLEEKHYTVRLNAEKGVLSVIDVVFDIIDENISNLL